MSREAPFVVVGAGIVGACIAYHLARAGRPVTLLDRSAGVPPATLRSFAWLGAVSGGTWPAGAEDLLHLVLDDHRDLAAEVPGTAHRWSGSLSWPTPPVAAPGMHLVDPDTVASMEPGLRTLPRLPALHIPTDAGLDPLTAVPALVREAQRLGARYRPDTPYTAEALPPAATVILAAGAATPALAGADLAVTASPAFGMRVAAPPGLVRRIVSMPGLAVREVRSGRYLLLAPWTPGAEADTVALGCLERFRAMLGVGDRARILAYAVVDRPLPAAGLIVGAVRPGCYVAVLHAGITFAPTVGRLLAAELTTGEPASELRRCRPARTVSG
jgi:glycine/D-amino acid oxidase-like deaminating enzyme